MHKSGQVQGDGIRYVEWDSRYPSPGLYSGSGRRGVSYISQNGNCEKDMKVRIVKASAMFGKMKKVWRNKHINLQT